MKNVVAQLNKIKIPATKADTLTPANVSDILCAIEEACGSIRGRSVCVHGDYTGLLVAGAGLHGPALAVAVYADTPDGRVAEIAGEAACGTSVVVSRKNPFNRGAFDLVVVYPPGPWDRGASAKCLEALPGAGKEVVGCVKEEYRKQMLAEFPGASVIGSVVLQPRQSAHYSKGGGKGGDKGVPFDIVRIRSP